MAAGCLALPRQQTAAAPGIRQPGGYRQVFADRPFIGLVAAEQAFTLIHLVLPVAMPIYAVRFFTRHLGRTVTEGDTLARRASA
ncbi:hypothetical protein [Nonomuraea sp. NPDC049129]|uniref:hypothetical protein n=1 Tax=Nonomuraea sp. NPDC049129 TaxID=3155272 RepID=UPI0033FBF673